MKKWMFHQPGMVHAYGPLFADTEQEAWKLVRMWYKIKEGAALWSVR